MCCCFLAPESWTLSRACTAACPVDTIRCAPMPRSGCCVATHCSHPHLLILAPSFNRMPLFLVLDARSDPARSMRDSLPVFTLVPLRSRCSTKIWRASTPRTHARDQQQQQQQQQQQRTHGIKRRAGGGNVVGMTLHPNQSFKTIPHLKHGVGATGLLVRGSRLLHTVLVALG
jgi:hypothetical protein